MWSKSKGKTLLPLAGLLLGLLLILPLRSTLVRADQEEKSITVRTMDTQTVLCGTAPADADIYVTVYMRKGEKRVILFSSMQEVGKSGLYQISIPLPVLGEQYVSVTMGNLVTTTRYVRYSANIRQKLSDSYLNIYESLLGGQGDENSR
ncbi:MAG: hypothetical protein HUJ69_03400 [Lachnospiraceae bacterium]|nr:hypothetical protein [Lachnospiraceae bacterium]